MARQEADREDLLQETVAYPRRGLLALDQPHGWVLLGERKQGAISIYYGTDSVFQFNRDGYLRRVFWQGIRWAAANGRLEALVRIKPALEDDVPPLEEIVHPVIHQRKTASELELQSMQSHWELWRQTTVRTTEDHLRWNKVFWDSEPIERSADRWHAAVDHFSRILRRMPHRFSIAQSPEAFAANPAEPCWLEEKA
jgi:hypothetical protein